MLVDAVVQYELWTEVSARRPLKPQTRSFFPALLKAKGANWI